MILSKIGFGEGGLFSWKGRMNRLSFFINYLILLIFMIICVCALVYYGLEENSDIAIGIGVVVFIFVFLRSLSLVARRLHDLGISGIGAIIIGIFSGLAGKSEIGSVICLLIQLIVMLYPGTAGENKYGFPSTKKISLT